MATENIVSKVYRVLTDVSSRVWDKISFWCLAKDVELANGKNLETTCGSITGITSSLTSTSKTMAASASAIKQLNDKIADLNSNLTNNFKLLASDRKVVSSDGSISFNTTSWTADKKRSILLLAYSQFYNGGASQDIHVYKNGAELTNYSFVFSGAHNADGGTFLIDVEKDDVISFLISGSSSDSKYAFWAIYGLE